VNRGEFKLMIISYASHAATNTTQRVVWNVFGTARMTGNEEVIAA